jgi:hypothetical protein
MSVLRAEEVLVQKRVKVIKRRFCRPDQAAISDAVVSPSKSFQRNIPPAKVHGSVRSVETVS